MVCAMSLIDWIIVIFGLLVGSFLMISGFGGFLLIRGFIRWVCGNEDDTLSRTKPRVRTRIQHSPIETEIADALAREYPNRKPATFV